MDPMTTIQAETEAAETAEATPESSSEAALAQQITTAMEQVSKGDISYSDLLKLVAPPPRLPVPPAAPPAIPVITTTQREALNKLVEVFGVVVPETRRKLAVPEVAGLIKERHVLDAIAKLATDRKEGIRTTVYNHFDVEVEEQAAAAREAGETVELPPRDSKGHYVKEGSAAAPGEDERFARETKSGGVNIDPEALRLLAEDPRLQAKLAEAGVEFSKADYLAMTTQVRVLDEAKVMLLLRRKPKLVHAIQAATTANPRTTSLFMRSAK